MHFGTDARIFAIDTRYNFALNFFGLIGCTILMKEHVSLTTAAMKMVARHFYSDHSNDC